MQSYFYSQERYGILSKLDFISWTVFLSNSWKFKKIIWKGALMHENKK